MAIPGGTTHTCRVGKGEKPDIIDYFLVSTLIRPSDGGKLGNLKQIVNILVPQIGEEIAEVSKSLDCVEQYPEPLL